jgi:hypothetical protein
MDIQSHLEIEVLKTLHIRRYRSNCPLCFVEERVSVVFVMEGLVNIEYRWQPQLEILNRSERTRRKRTLQHGF